MLFPVFLSFDLICVVVPSVKPDGKGRRFTLQGFIRYASFRRFSTPAGGPLITRMSRKGSKSAKSCKRTDRTSKMLIAVLVLFLLTEFPQGIMHFLTGTKSFKRHRVIKIIRNNIWFFSTGWYGPDFLRCKYNPWAEIWDIVALINSGINFILYCFMSKQFRTQFAISFNTFCPKREHLRWGSLPACNNNATVSTTV